MQIQLFFVTVVLFQCSFGLLPKHYDMPSNTASKFWQPFRFCCFDDPCNEKKICARSSTILSDGCNRNYEVSSQCKLLSITCCQPDPCAGGAKKCAKLQLKSEPTTPVPKDDILCSGMIELLGDDKRLEQCSSTSLIRPIDIIAEGTMADMKRNLLQDGAAIPFEINRITDSGTFPTSSVHAFATTPRKTLPRKKSRYTEPLDIEFGDCNPLRSGDCKFQFSIIVRERVSTSRSALTAMVLDAVRKSESSVEFSSLIQKTSFDSSEEEINPGAGPQDVACSRYRSAYFCLQYSADAVW